MEVSPLGQVQLVPIGSVKPYDTNPRRISDKAIEQTAESIREFGWQQPLVVDAEHVLIVGHTRLLAAKMLGLLSVPVIVDTRLSPEQVRAYRIVDNRSHDYTVWDYPQLLLELEGIGGEFDKVLDLADWRAIIEQFESAQSDADIDPGDEAGAYLSNEHSLTVIFASRELADQGGVAILEIPGVINVRQSAG